MLVELIAQAFSLRQCFPFPYCSTPFPPSCNKVSPYWSLFFFNVILINSSKSRLEREKRKKVRREFSAELKAIPDWCVGKGENTAKLLRFQTNDRESIPSAHTEQKSSWTPWCKVGLEIMAQPRMGRGKAGQWWKEALSQVYQIDLPSTNEWW